MQSDELSLKFSTHMVDNKTYFKRHCIMYVHNNETKRPASEYVICLITTNVYFICGSRFFYTYFDYFKPVLSCVSVSANISHVLHSISYYTATFLIRPSERDAMPIHSRTDFT